MNGLPCPECLSLYNLKGNHCVAKSEIIVETQVEN